MQLHQLGYSNMNELRRFLPHFSIVGKSMIVAVVILVLIGQVFILLPPLLFGLAIDGLAAATSISVYWTLFAIFLLALIKAVFTPLQARYITGIVQKMTLSYSLACTERIFSRNYHIFKSRNVGGVLKRSERGIEGFESFLGFLLILAIPSLISLFIISSYLAFLVGPLAFFALCCAAIIFIAVSNQIIKWRRKYIDQVNDAEDDVAEIYAESFLAAIALRGAGRIAAAIRSLGSVYTFYADRSTSLAFASGVLSASQDFISTLTIIITVSLGAYLISDASYGLTVGDFVVVFTYVSMFMSNVSQIMEVRKRYDQFKADIFEMDQILSQPSDREGLPERRIIPKKLTVEPFQRTTGPKLSLSQKLQFDVGSTVAIVGETGSGKTSFLEILSGLDFMKTGIYLDDVDLSSIGQQALGGAIFYAPQSARFLTGPFEHAVLFDQHLDSSLSRQHIENLQLAKFIDSLPSQVFPTSHFSGGESNRFALIRALTAEQPIIILDEPTSAMDDEIANTVWDYLLTSLQGKLLICSTHDTKVLGRFDQVIEVTKGKIILRN